MTGKFPHLTITLVAALLLIPFGGLVHLFDWDEINFAEAAREMLATGNYGSVTINYEPFWEKPPLFLWMQALCMKFFGTGEFAARLPNALCGVATLNVLFYYGKKFVNERTAWWWVILYAGSLTPHFYFRTGIIDPVFNLFIFLSLISLFEASVAEGKTNRFFVRAGLFLGLALLTKGPVAVIISGLTVLAILVIRRFRGWFSFSQVLIFLFCFFLVPALWLLPGIIRDGFWFTREFLYYQADLFLHPVASHGQPWYYHPLVLLIGCFPVSVIAIPVLFFRANSPFNENGERSIVQTDLLKWMIALFWVVLVLFSMVTTKIVHYSSMCYIPMTFAGAWLLSGSGGELKNWQRTGILILATLYGIIFTLIPLIFAVPGFRERITGAVKDDFVRGNLTVNGSWQGWEWAAGIVFIVFCFWVLLGIYRRSPEQGIKKLLLANVVFFSVVSAILVPRIERHVQGSIIDFYKTLRGKDVYIETVGFKSYAHYYYPEIRPPHPDNTLRRALMNYCRQNQLDTLGRLNEEGRNAVNGYKKQWLMTGPADKPVYLVYKVDRTEEIDSSRLFKKVMDKGGFRVYERLPEIGL